MGKIIIIIDLILSILSCSSQKEEIPKINQSLIKTNNLIWDLEYLQKPPAFRFLDSTSRVREILFNGPNHYGKPTKVFAYYSNPDILRTGSDQGNKFPGVVLISGGHQEAIKEWVERWAYEGYAAINCDYGNMREMPGGVPTSTTEYIYDSIKYGPKSVREYRSVEIAIMAHSLLLSFPEVDKGRTAVTGISWGGFQTCIVAGLDDRFKAAVPVYGCGFHDETIFNKYFKDMSPENKSLWMKTIDPRNYIGSTQCPVLFVNGNNDGCFDIIPWYKTTLLVPEKNRYLCLTPGLGHSHVDGWRPKETAAFFNSIFRDGIPLSRITGYEKTDTLMRFKYESRMIITKADFYYSNDTVSINADRIWESVPAKIFDDRIESPFPEKGFLMGFLYVRDAMDLGSSSELIINFNPVKLKTVK